jgi:hypothetical protein
MGESKINESRKIKDRILEGEDVVGEEQAEVEKESGKEKLTAEQILDKAVNDGEIKGIYADMVKAGQGDLVLKDIAQQAQNLGADGEPLNDGNEAISKKSMISQFGKEVVDAAIERYKYTNGESEQISQPIELDPTLPEGYELPGQPKEEAGSVGVEGEAKFDKVYYHGTPNKDFKGEFDENRIGERDSGFLGTGFYFTDDKSIAEPYRHKGGKKGVILERRLDIKNPLILDKDNVNPKELAEDIFKYIDEQRAKNGKEPYRQESRESDIAELTKGIEDAKHGIVVGREIKGWVNPSEYAKSRGYDAIVGSKEILVFEKSQIKEVEQPKAATQKSDIDTKKEAIETEKQQAITEATKPVVDLELLGDEQQTIDLITEKASGDKDGGKAKIRQHERIRARLQALKDLIDCV